MEEVAAMTRFALAAVALLLPAARAAADRPNVVFILTDDLGREDCGIMGGTQIRTPNLDRLAAAGSRFDAHYAQPVCSPMRAALMTGRYPMRHGLQVGVVRPWARYRLPLGERTLAQALQGAGYATAAFGKWHLGHFEPAYLPTRRGFGRQYGHYNGAIDYFTHVRDGGFDWHRDDRVCRDEGYSTHLLAKEAAAFVAATAGKRPFFLYFAFNAVHAPHQVPAEYTKPYAHLRGERKLYAGMLAATDEAVGTVLAAVERAGVREDTLFVFSSDNGGPAPGASPTTGSTRPARARSTRGASASPRSPPGTATSRPSPP
jgi:arylsulfatase A-like enzyme